MEEVQWIAWELLFYYLSDQDQKFCRETPCLVEVYLLGYVYKCGYKAIAWVWKDIRVNREILEKG